MSASPAVLSPNPDPKIPLEDWTIVTSRRRRTRRSSSGNPTSPSDPCPWTPLDRAVDPARSTNLLRKIESTIQRLEKSRFYKHFIARFNSEEIKSQISRIRDSDNPIGLVAYGIGSFESYPAPRLQLALAKLLRHHIGADVAEIFDPVFSSTECHVAEQLGFKVILTNEHGRRKVTTPTIFFMPHCEAELYNALLETNWRPSDLNRMVVIGNSFSEYARYVEEAGKTGGSVKVQRVGKRILEARKFVKELEVELGFGGEDLESGFFQAFHDTSWHFFQVEDDTDLEVMNG